MEKLQVPRQLEPKANRLQIHRQITKVLEYSVFYLLDSRFVQSNDTPRILNPVHALLWLSPGFDFAVDVNDLIFFEITQSKH